MGSTWQCGRVQRWFSGDDQKQPYSSDCASEVSGAETSHLGTVRTTSTVPETPSQLDQQPINHPQKHFCHSSQVEPVWSRRTTHWVHFPEHQWQTIAQQRNYSGSHFQGTSTIDLHLESVCGSLGCGTSRYQVGTLGNQYQCWSLRHFHLVQVPRANWKQFQWLRFWQPFRFRQCKSWRN